MSELLNDRPRFLTRGRGSAIVWCAAVTLMLTAYVGAYLSLASQQSESVMWLRVEHGVIMPPTPHRMPVYYGSKQTNAILKPFFRPIHLLDQKLRPAKWLPVVPVQDE